MMVVALAASLAVAQKPPAVAEDMSHGRAIRNFALELMVRYHKPVTVEDPFWLWEGDFKVVGRHREKPQVPLREIRDSRMELPSWFNPTDTPSLDAEVVRRLLREFHRLNPGDLQYRVETSWLGIHILPEFMHDAQGRLIPARLPLDAVVTVPRARRSATAHYSALCQALSAASGLKAYGLTRGSTNSTGQMG